MRSTFVSLFSGVGGFDLGLARAGWHCAGQVEIDPFCARVLARHWPEVPRWGDITTVTGEEILATMRTGTWYRKLRPEQADASVTMYEQGMSCAAVTEYFGVSRQSMWDLLRRRTTLRPQKRLGADNHFYRGGPSDDDAAQNVCERAIRAGVLEKIDRCEACSASGVFKDGRTMVQAHHDDYNHPLRVRWLCQRCHHEWHTTHRAIPKAKGGDAHENPTPVVDLLCGGFP